MYISICLDLFRCVCNVRFSFNFVESAAVFATRLNPCIEVANSTSTMEGASSSSTKAMSHAARATARKHLYESIVETAQALVRKSTNPDIIQGCSAAIALYTTRITEIRKQRGQGRKDRKRRAVAKSKARIYELEATMGEALDHMRSRSEGSQDDNADDDEDHDDASHENVKEFSETWAKCHV